MRLLFTEDRRDYDPNGGSGSRISVRGVIFRDGRLALIHSLTYGWYCFPGGGAEEGETLAEALAREVAEETGLTVIPGSERGFGSVLCLQKGRQVEILHHDNHYFFCEAEDSVGAQRLSEQEKKAQFVLEFVPLRQAIEHNRSLDVLDGAAARDTRVMELLLRELGDGYEDTF